MQWLRRILDKAVDGRHRELNAYLRLICCMYREHLFRCKHFRELVQANVNSP